MAKGEKTPKKHRLPDALKENLWEAGQSGNPKGRPKGSKNKYTEAFYTDILDEWMEGGKEAIRQVRKADPATFLRVCASILPKDINISDTREIAFDRFIDGLNDSQLDELIAGLCALGSSGQGEAFETEKGAGKRPDRVH